MPRPDTYRRRMLAAMLTSVVLVPGAAAASPTADAAVTDPPCGADAAKHRPTFTDPTRITNPWLPLTAQHRVELRGVKEGRQVRSVRTRLDRTKRFVVFGQSLRAVVVEDRAYENGTLHWIALDYYAQADDGTVYHLGEDVDIFDRTGTRVVDHDGASLYGRDTRTLGVAMPARPFDGQRFTSASIPGQGSERNRVADTNGRLTVPAGTYGRVLEVHAHLLPEHENEVKFYARGTGLLKEQGPTGYVELVSAR